MNSRLDHVMREALSLVRRSNLIEATATIRAALSNPSTKGTHQVLNSNLISVPSDVMLNKHEFKAPYSVVDAARGEDESERDGEKELLRIMERQGFSGETRVFQGDQDRPSSF